MRIIVQYSGGKDSQASLLWAVQKWGTNNVEVAFCNTGWESPLTYAHIIKTTADLGIKPKFLTSQQYTDFIDLVTHKKRFPSTKTRFCTEELKAKPFIDYVLDEVKQNFFVVQGIRADESLKRSKMLPDCRYFKYYFEPYTNNKIKLDEALEQRKKLYQKNKIIPLNLRNKIEALTQKVNAGILESKYFNYRKKDVIEFVKQYTDDLYRPVFYWTAQQVIDYIIANGQRPNPLYEKGFKRVGCFPCIQCNHEEIRMLIKHFPEQIDEIDTYEKELNTSFFTSGYIPDRYCSKSAVAKTGKNKGKLVKYPTIRDVVRYLNDKNATGNLFEQEETSTSCMSIYSGVCE